MTETLASLVRDHLRDGSPAFWQAAFAEVGDREGNVVAAVQDDFADDQVGQWFRGMLHGKAARD